MTKTQEQVMKGWFRQETWRDIKRRLGRWRLWGLCCATIPPSRPPPSDIPAAGSPVSDTTTLVDEDVRQGPWGEERDSWANRGWAPYFGGQWNGVFPGPGPETPPLPPDSVDVDVNDEVVVDEASY
jgi:hypothetical protein